MASSSFLIRQLMPEDVEFVRAELIRNWLSTVIWSRGVKFRADELPGFVGVVDNQPAGLVTFAALPEGDCEIVTLSSRVEDCGLGTALLDAAVGAARGAGHLRVVLTTTNDNLRALGFYQRRGWRLVAVHRGAVDRCREHQKDIPMIGMNGIPLHDEIELELVLCIRS